MVHITQLDVTSQRRSTQVIDVEAYHLPVVLEVEFVIVVVTAYLGWVDRERGGNVAVVHLQSHGIVGLGMKVVLRVNIVHRALGVDVVAGLVAQESDEPLLLRSGYVVGIVLHLKIVFRKFAYQPFS